MTYLGLDQSPSIIGYAIGSPDMAAPIVGTFKVPSHGDNFGASLAAVSKWFRKLVGDYEVESVCFESPFIPSECGGYARPLKRDGGKRRGPSAVVVRHMCALADHIDFVCFTLGVECREVECQVWRKRFIGRGNSPRHVHGTAACRAWLKEQAMRSCAGRRWNVSNDHEAEACGILDYLIACNDPKYGARSGSPLLENAA